MYEETKLEFLPKYFENLHLEIAAITGSPRIVNTKNPHTSTDKYKNIPQDEWESAILNWAKFLDNGFVQILTDGTFLVAGKIDTENKEQVIPGVIQSLRNLADKLSRGDY